MSHKKQKNLDKILGVGWKRNTRILSANTSSLLYRHFLRRSRVNPPSATLSSRAVVTRLSFRAVSCCADDGGYRPRPGRHEHQVGACVQRRRLSLGRGRVSRRHTGWHVVRSSLSPPESRRQARRRAEPHPTIGEKMLLGLPNSTGYKTGK